MKNQIMKCSTTVIAAIALGGCTYVSLSEAGSQVAQSDADAVAACTLVGNISSQTKDKVLVDRNTGKVKEELIVLARNRAAELGATDLVQIGDVDAGTASFNAYRCN
jgi:hypothetical protein